MAEATRHPVFAAAKRALKRRPLLASTLLRLYCQLRYATRPSSAQAYLERPIEIGPAEVSVNDFGVACFLQATLGVGYHKLIEIGTMNGARAIHLKRLLPQVDVCACDIQPAFDNFGERHGVHFGRFGEAFFAEHCNPDSLVISQSTLCCIPPDELMTFLQLLRTRGCGIAFFEPCPLFEPNQSLLFYRTPGYGVWFHPYAQLARALSFEERADHNHSRWVVSMNGPFCKRFYHWTPR